MPRTSGKELHQLVGLVKEYRNIWESRSHTLSPLTKVTSSKVYYKWDKIEQEASKYIQRIVSQDGLSSYQDFNKKIKIRTTERNTQSRAVITQYGKQLAFYSRKLNGIAKCGKY